MKTTSTYNENKEVQKHINTLENMLGVEKGSFIAIQEKVKEFNTLYPDADPKKLQIFLKSITNEKKLTKNEALLYLTGCIMISELN